MDFVLRDCWVDIEDLDIFAQITLIILIKLDLFRCLWNRMILNWIGDELVYSIELYLFRQRMGCTGSCNVIVDVDEF